MNTTTQSRRLTPAQAGHKVRMADRKARRADPAAETARIAAANDTTIRNWAAKLNYRVGPIAAAKILRDYADREDAKARKADLRRARQAEKAPKMHRRDGQRELARRTKQIAVAADRAAARERWISAMDAVARAAVRKLSPDGTEAGGWFIRPAGQGLPATVVTL